MATTDTSADALFEHRLSMIIDQGFNVEEALTLVNATKIVVNKESHRTYEYEVPLSWHDVAKLKRAGATNEQIIAILK
jgi:hypothetical protein